MIKEISSKSYVRIAGLDTLRFFAALWVVISHEGTLPLFAGHDPDSKVAWAMNGLYNGAFSGPAAVILFFLISGFCIHYPYATGKKFAVGEFLVRRIIRITIPMAAAILVARSIGFIKSPDILAGIPAWSLVAELIYYGLYPILRVGARRLTWVSITAFSFVVAFIFCFTAKSGSLNYPSWGYGGDWLLGLPCWLMGVLLAEDRTYWACLKVSVNKVWKYRLIAIALGAITHNLKLQQIVPEYWTLNFFAIFCYFWLGVEIRYCIMHPPRRIYEKLGEMSYSIYLIHVSATQLLTKFPIPNFGFLANWLIMMAFVMGFSILFYVLIELPSHKLAKGLSKYVSHPIINISSTAPEN